MITTKLQPKTWLLDVYVFSFIYVTKFCLRSSAFIVSYLLDLCTNAYFDYFLIFTLNSSHEL